MSTLKTNTLSNLAGSQSTPIENAINGSAKAWVNFNGTGTVAIRAGYNVSSITDNGVGDYTLNFTNALVDANYAAVAMTGTYTALASNDAPAPTTGQFRFILRVCNSPTTSTDAAYVYVSIFR